MKNLRISVNNLMTSPNAVSGALSAAQRRLLNEVVLSCQAQEGAVSSVVTAGDYQLNFSGKDYSSYMFEGSGVLDNDIFTSVKQKDITNFFFYNVQLLFQ